MNRNPYYVVTYGGFLVVESHDDQEYIYTVADARCATAWKTFDEADQDAKRAVDKIYPSDLRYFAIFQPAFE